MHECMWRVHVCMCVQVYVCVVCDMYLIVYVQLVGENLCVYGIQGVHVGGCASQIINWLEELFLNSNLCLSFLQMQRSFQVENLCMSRRCLLIPPTMTSSSFQTSVEGRLGPPTSICPSFLAPLHSSCALRSRRQTAPQHQGLGYSRVLPRTWNVDTDFGDNEMWLGHYGATPLVYWTCDEYLSVMLSNISSASLCLMGN